MNRTNRLITAGVMGVVIATLSGCGSDGGGNTGSQKPKALPAHVLTLKAQPLVIHKSYPSLLRSHQQVQVVARINGFLEQRSYTEGDYVKKGQKLFTIEPAPYKAQVEQKAANLASARATEKKNQRQWDRISTLYKHNAVSKQARDTALSNLETSKAAVKQAKAELDQAKITFAYTSVNAPVSGMASLRQVNVGDLVHAGDPLMTITPLSPIQALFSLPVADASALRAQRQAGSQAPQVTARIMTDSGKKITGKVDFLGSQVNQQTSTVQARATFQNSRHLLIPGDFVSVQLLHLRLPHILAVPQIAITEGQEGPQVYTLNKHNKVKPVDVETGTITDNHWIVINSGLKSGDRVVVNRISKIKPEIRIKPQPVHISPNGGGQGQNQDNGKGQKQTAGRAHGGPQKTQPGDQRPTRGAHSAGSKTSGNSSRYAGLGRSLKYAEKASLSLDRQPVKPPQTHTSQPRAHAD
jgi:membrane fusion protein (multidrug efflux system)